MAEVDKLIFTLDADLAPLQAKIAAAEGVIQKQATTASSAQGAIDKLTASYAGLANATAAAGKNQLAGGGTSGVQQLTSDLVSAKTAGQALAAEGLAPVSEGLGKVSLSAREIREPFTLIRELSEGSALGFVRAAAGGAAFAGRLGVLGALFSPLGIAITAATAATIGFLVAQEKYATSQQALSNAIRLGGEAAGESRGQLEALAQTTSASGEISVKAARSIEATYAQTGQIGGQVFVDLTKATEDYAAATGQSTSKAAEELAKIFKDPAKGAKDLDDAYNLLTQAQLENITTMAQSGDRAGAQAALLLALTQRTQGATEGAGYLAQAWNAVAKAFNNAADAVGGYGAKQQPQQTVDALTAQKNAPPQTYFGGSELGAIGQSGGGGQLGVLQFLGFSGIGWTAADQAKLDQGIAEAKAAADKAAQDLQRSQNIALGKQATEVADQYTPVAGKIQELTQAQKTLTAAMELAAQPGDAEADHFGRISNAAGMSADALNRAATATANLAAQDKSLLDPLTMAEAKLKNLQATGSQSPAQRAVSLARSNATTEALASPTEAAEAPQLGAVAGQTATAEQANAAGNAATQMKLEADAAVRLAQASGVSTDAVRKAEIANKAAAFAYEHAGMSAAAYAAQVARLTEAQRQGEVNAEALSLNQSADAAERLAAATSKGAAAAQQAKLANEAFALALKAGAQGSKEFTDAYNQYLAALQRGQTANTTTAFEEELQKRKDALQIAQAELALIGKTADERDRELAVLKEKLEIERQIPGITQQEEAALLQVSATTGTITGQIQQQKQAQTEFNDLVKQGTDAIGSALEGLVTGTKTWKQSIADVEKSLLKIGTDALITNPLKKWLEGALNGSGDSDGGSGSGGALGGLEGGLLKMLGLPSGGLLQLLGLTGGGATPTPSGLPFFSPGSPGSGFLQYGASAATSAAGAAGSAASAAGSTASTTALTTAATTLTTAGTTLTTGSTTLTTAATALTTAATALTTAAAALEAAAAAGAAGGAAGGAGGALETASFSDATYGAAITAAAKGRVFSGGNVVPYAKGGVFEHHRPVRPFAEGGVFPGGMTSEGGDVTPFAKGGVFKAAEAIDHAEHHLHHHHVKPESALVRGLGFAKGGVFETADAIHHRNVVPFARGGHIVTHPMVFPMAHGDVGLMGEAGSEAVMPLTRNSRGQLGVHVGGAGGGSSGDIHLHMGGMTFHGNPTPSAAQRAGATMAQMSVAALKQASRHARRFGR